MVKAIADAIIADIIAESVDLHAEVKRLKEDHSRACETVAAMHAAAVGEVTGPIRGVVEDVEDLRLERDRLRKSLQGLHDVFSSTLQTCPRGMLESAQMRAMKQWRDELAKTLESQVMGVSAPNPEGGV